MFCPECGKENKNRAAFCAACGTVLEEQTGSGQTQKLKAGGGREDADTIRIHDLLTAESAAAGAAASSYCPHCGRDNRSQAAFCSECGGRMGATATAAESTPPAELQQPGDQPTPGQTMATASGSKMKRKLLLAGAIIFMLAAVGGAGYYFGFRDDAQADDSKLVSTDTDRTDDSREDKDDDHTRTGINTRTSMTSTQGGSQQARDYVAAMDPLIAENVRLEQQIVATAAEINRVAPNGITNVTLTSINDLKAQFEEIESQAARLSPPASFSRADSDFRKLVGYNITRCQSLHDGADAWRKGWSNYESQFDVGGKAKDEYVALYPVFENEYSSAKKQL